MKILKITCITLCLMSYANLSHAGFWDRFAPTKEKKPEIVVETVEEEAPVESVTVAELENAADAKEAISMAQRLSTAAEQMEYLLAQANRLLTNEAFLQVKEIAQYILTNLDPQSVEAKGLLAAATDGLKNAASNKVNNLKSQFGF